MNLKDLSFIRSFEDFIQQIGAFRWVVEKKVQEKYIVIQDFPLLLDYSANHRLHAKESNGQTPNTE